MRLHKHFMTPAIGEIEHYTFELAGGVMPPMLVSREFKRIMEEFPLNGVFLRGCGGGAYKHNLITLAPGCSKWTMGSRFPELICMNGKESRWERFSHLYLKLASNDVIKKFKDAGVT